MRAVAAITGLLTVTAAACAPAQRELVFDGPTMGTTYTVRTVGSGTVRAAELRSRIDATLAQIDAEMSTYRDDSALARFNASPSTEWYAVPVDLARVIAAAQDLAEMTDGAFDVTVAPLVDLWGFGSDEVPPSIPAREAVAAARERVGFRQLDVRLEPPALRKHRADLHVDLNAIAPGYAVDRIAAQLESASVVDYLVDVGGELRARGVNGQARIWRVAVERPSEGPREVYTIVELDDAAIATSGDYRQYFEVDGRRYSHTLDPRTARPVEHALASVAVISESAMMADGLATALAVLGPDAGREFVATRGLAALFLVRDGPQLVEASTPAFDRLRVDGRS